MNDETQEVSETAEGRGEASELSALLSAVEAVEQELREKRDTLLEKQHYYLEAVGFIIEPMQGGFRGDYVYRRGDETFIDADHAMEYAEE